MYLTLCFWVIKQDGICEGIAQPFSMGLRDPGRLSAGHKIHNRMMTVGWRTPNPKTFADFDEALNNIRAESWCYNAMKSNFRIQDIENALDIWANVVKTSDSGRLVEGHEHEDQGYDDETFVIPSDDAWKKVFAAAGGM